MQKTDKIGKEKTFSPNKLPFLQSQILQKIFIDINNNVKSDIEDIAQLTDYKKESKILDFACKALITKKFIEGNFDIGFSIPSNRIELYNFVIKKNDYEHKHYSNNILKFKYINKKNDNEQSLFDNFKTISDYNREGVCHRWYDYLEDFPFILIEDNIKEYNINENSLIVDPFAGSGTTNVTAKMFNIHSIGLDANPLMAFISRVKTTWDIDLNLFKIEVIDVATKFLQNILNFEELNIDCNFLEKMPKKELNQWLSFALQKEVVLLKHYIKEVKDNKIRDLLLLAMSRSALDASYVSFCPGTTFYPFREKEEFWNLFTNKVIDIITDLEIIKNSNLIYAKANLINDTCLSAHKQIQPNTVDFIITSPPYPNDLEYTRQTRLEMYLLDFVNNMKDIQKIKGQEKLLKQRKII